MAAKRLPLTVVGGFLGAGKTTLLNHWLRHAAGQRLAVLVNDFGAMNIDAELIESSSTPGSALTTLTNGCVCCQIGDDLSLALIQILDRADDFDAIVIEASGVSDPWRVAQMGRADPGLSLEAIVVLVDAQAALADSRDPRLMDTLQRQLRAADLVVLNKCDEPGDATRAALREWIESVAGAVPVLETTQARVPMGLLGGLTLPGAVPEGDHADLHEHASDAGHDPNSPIHGAVFETWSARPEAVYSAVALREWLNSAPQGLLRLKGIVRTAQASWSQIQIAGRRGSLREAPAPRGGAAVVAIALRGQLPRDALQRLFAPQP